MAQLLRMSSTPTVLRRVLQKHSFSDPIQGKVGHTSGKIVKVKK